MTLAPPSPAFPRRRLAWALALTGCVGLGAFGMTYPLNHDVGWYLQLARSMLEGETLYTTLIEVNPPLYAYLAMLPVELAEGLGVSAVPSMKVSLLVASLAAVAWAGMLGGRDVASEGNGDGAPLVAVAFGLPVLGLAGVDFGQREHLMVALTAPYLVLAARRGYGGSGSSGRSGSSGHRAPALIAGVLAGIGFSLKPHFVLLWLALELWLLVRSREARSVRRVEAMGVVGFLFAYAGFVALVHPEYLRLLRDAGPLYADYLSVDRLRLLANRYSVLLVVTGGAYLLCPPFRGLKPLVAVLLVAAGLAFLMAVGQGKGWLYHFFPALAWTVAAGFLLLADYFPRLLGEAGRIHGGRVLAVILLLTAGVLGGGSLILHHQELARARSEYVAEQSRYFESHGVRSIVILSPSLPAAFPLVNYAGVEWPAPFPSLWWVAGAHAADPPRANPEDVPVPRSPVEAAFLHTMAAGIARRPPDIVLVDTAGIGRSGDVQFPYVAYLLQDPTFVVLWDQFDARGTLGPFHVYSRRPPGGADDRR